MEQATTPGASASTRRRGRRQRKQEDLVLGVIVAPRLARDVPAAVADELVDDLRRQYGTVEWRAERTVDRLVVPPAPSTELFDAARRKLLENDWDLAVVVTDLPLQRGRRPATRQVSPTHGIAVVSLPALGAIQVRHRLRRTLLELVSELVGDLAGEPEDHASTEQRRARARRRRAQRVLSELAAETFEPSGRLSFRFVREVLVGNLWLLVGMVRANRPWRLAVRLYGALVAAFGAGAFGVVTDDIWLISGAMSWWRLTIASVVSIAATMAAIVVVHGLWEHAPDPRVREQVALFNIATTATVAIGILSLYAALYVLTLAASALVITPGLLTDVIGRQAGVADYAALAWFISSLATIGGALGAGLESDEAIREAAYAVASSEEQANRHAAA